MWIILVQLLFINAQYTIDVDNNRIITNQYVPYEKGTIDSTTRLVPVHEHEIGESDVWKCGKQCMQGGAATFPRVIYSYLMYFYVNLHVKRGGWNKSQNRL